MTRPLFLASDTEHSDGACAPRAHIVACDTAAHLPGRVANELTEVGWPATGGAVQAVPRPKCEAYVPLMLAKDKRNERARARYAALRAAGVAAREARKMRCKGAP